MPKVVSIHSYRGGTGKSNFTANLATTVALQGNRVAVIDTDLPSPIHNLFCLEPEQIHQTLNNYIWKETFLSIAISHLLILILRPDKQDYQGTAVTIEVARKLKVRKMLLAINKVHSKLNRDALKHKVEETYGETVAGVFPLSEEIVELGSEGVFCVKYPEHQMSKEFHKIVQKIAEA